jgi:hypothetical protein
MPFAMVKPEDAFGHFQLLEQVLVKTALLPFLLRSCPCEYNLTIVPAAMVEEEDVLEEAVRSN